MCRLLDGPAVAGSHFVRWDGRDDQGSRVSPGIYFLRLDTDRPQPGHSASLTRKLVVVQ